MPDKDTPVYVLCVPVMRYERKRALHREKIRAREPHVSRPTVSGLILQVTERPGVYKRLGMFDTLEEPGLGFGKQYFYGEMTRNLFRPDGMEGFLDRQFWIV